MADVCKSIKLLPTIIQPTEILPLRLFHMRKSNAASPKSPAKGLFFKEDDCTLSVNLSTY